MLKKIVNKLTTICANIASDTVRVNGKTYKVPSGSSITIEGDNVHIGDQVVSIHDKIINISIQGNVGAAMTTSGDIHVTGNSGTIQSTSGDISVGHDSMDIQTTSGDVEVGGKVEGNVTTVSGCITHH
jgi:hypothetical protein